MSFVLSVKTKRGETWYHCYGGQVTKDEKCAHVFENIGRAQHVANQRYVKRHLGYGLKGVYVKKRENRIELTEEEMQNPHTIKESDTVEIVWVKKEADIVKRTDKPVTIYRTDCDIMREKIYNKMFK